MDIFADVRYALRLLRKTPVFTVAAIGTLALGIGANTTIFSLVQTMLLQPLPYQDPDRIVTVWEDRTAAGFPRNQTAPGNYLDWREMNRSFTGMAADRMRFRMALDPRNRGVRLRRLTDLAAGTQLGMVMVDGVAAGWWQTADVNPFKRWAEVEFEIPEALTEGKSSIEVDVDARVSPNPWTAYEYVAPSHLP